MSRFAALLLMCLLFSSCKKENNTDPMGLQEFLKREDCGLFGHGGFLFRYNESHCQFSINSMRRQVRMQDDTQSDYVNIQFTVFPTPSAEGVELLLRYKVGDDEISSRCFMEIVKYESDKFWLCSQTHRGYCRWAKGAYHQRIQKSCKCHEEGL